MIFQLEPRRKLNTEADLELPTSYFSLELGFLVDPKTRSGRREMRLRESDASREIIPSRTCQWVLGRRHLGLYGEWHTDVRENVRKHDGGGGVLCARLSNGCR